MHRMNNEVKDILEKAYRQGHLNGFEFAILTNKEALETFLYGRVIRDKFTLLNEEKEDI